MLKIKKNTNKKDLIVLILLLVLVFFIVKKTIVEKNNRSEVISNLCFSSGRIVYYSIGGEESSVRLEYEYCVNKKIYNRTILRYSSKYDYCKDNIEYCKSKLFRVAYSKRNPQFSLIDLSKEIQDEKEPVISKNLDNFE